MKDSKQPRQNETIELLVAQAPPLSETTTRRLANLLGQAATR